MRVRQTQSVGVRYSGVVFAGKECTAAPQRSEQQQAQARRESNWHNRGSTTGEGSVRVKLVLKRRRKRQRQRSWALLGTAPCEG